MYLDQTPSIYDIIIRVSRKQHLEQNIHQIRYMDLILRAASGSYAPRLTVVVFMSKLIMCL
jgi:hypothetical protein